MPHAPRGRHRGRHRRARIHHVPAAVGSLAVATAAAGALTVSSGATASLAAGRGSVAAAARPTAPTTLATPSAAELARLAALRTQERVERSSERAQVAKTAADTAARAAAASESALAGADATRVARSSFEHITYVVPVAGYHLTSRFGPRWGTMHTGLDMAAPSGTEIHALGAGEVIFADWDGHFGQKIIIHMDDGTEVWYCHQSKFAVTSGRVAAGQLIGYVGSTGNSTGPHLHIEIHPNAGDAVDPLAWMQAHGLTIDGA